MPGKAAKRNKRRMQKSDPTRVIAIGTIKSEIVDDWQEIVGSRNNETLTSSKPKKPNRVNPFIIKTEKTDNGAQTVNIKTENSDRDDSVMFIPNHVPTITIENSPAHPPPQKKTKLNNGRSVPAQSKNPVIKKEHSSSRRKRIARLGNNQRPINNHYNNYFFNKPNNDARISYRILNQIQITPSEMRSLMQQHRQEITNLCNNLLLQTERELRGDYIERLIVARIKVLNLANISLDTIYRDMRRDIFRWIERFQRMGQMPFYHNIFIDEPFIIVLCANSHAYDCLCEYINFTYSHPNYRYVNIEYMPKYAGRTLFCYAATVNDIIYDSDSFLKQMHLHLSTRGGSANYTDQWIMVRQHVHFAERFTSFLFFMDYTSSLTVEYIYQNSLFVCLLSVQFAYRGVVHCDF